jgi:hypothetical protein
MYRNSGRWLLLVLLVAVALRIPAVVYSKGYMASDDHYETVAVAYQWLRGGITDEQGLLLWGNNHPGEVGRSPLYALGLYAVMRVFYAAGVDDLDSMMYGIRALHALLSLLSVWAGFRLVELITKSPRTATVAGLILAAHFAMPYLAVRNLIEFVAGHFWLVALLFLYYHREGRGERWLFAAGLMTGLAWLVRFEIAVAAVAVVPILWYEARSARPAIIYAFGVLPMLLLGGAVDWILLGVFAKSTFLHINQVLTETPPYQTIRLVYVAVLTAFFIPPFSLVAFYLAGKSSFWRRHRLLVITTLVFIIAHTLSASRQERYMLPIVSTMSVIVVLAVWRHIKDHGFFARRPKLLWSVTGLAVIVNLTLLPVFTMNYSHKAVVSPLARIEQIQPGAELVMVAPRIRQMYPVDYAGFKSARTIRVGNWSELRILGSGSALRDSVDYFITYPDSRGAIRAYRDSLQAYVGRVDLVFDETPDPIDALLHWLNPGHNPPSLVQVYRPLATHGALSDPPD